MRAYTTHLPNAIAMNSAQRISHHRRDDTPKTQSSRQSRTEVRLGGARDVNAHWRVLGASSTTGSRSGCCPEGTPKEPLAEETGCPRKAFLTAVGPSALGRLDD
eukprot:6109725-Prymnesium_polylepis.1